MPFQLEYIWSKKKFFFFVSSKRAGDYVENLCVCVFVEQKINKRVGTRFVSIAQRKFLCDESKKIYRGKNNYTQSKI